MEGLRTVLGPVGATDLVEEAYWARQTTPGWPPAFHAATAPTGKVEMVQIPLAKLEAIGAILAIAIVVLAGITLYAGRQKKKTRV